MSYKTGGIHDWDPSLSEFIQKHFAAVISTVDEHWQPASAMIYYGSEDEGRVLFFLTKSESRKIENIKHNAKVSFLIPDVRNMSTLELEGDAYVNDDSGDIMRWIKQIVEITKREEVDGWLPVLQTEAVGLVLVKFVPERWALAEYSKWYPGEGR